MRSLFLFVSFIVFTTLSSQTLYWVGGSGNFNDPQHWSLSSNGPPANFIPNSTTDVVFDDNSGAGITVSMAGNNQIRSLKTFNAYNRINFIGSKSSTLTAGGSFELNAHSVWDAAGEVRFQTTGGQVNNVTFGYTQLNTNLSFGSGIYKINAIFQAPQTTIKFEGGNYSFRRGSVSVNDLVISGSGTTFKIDTSFFMVKGKLLINDKCNFITNKFSFIAPFSNSLRSSTPNGMNFGAVTRLTDNSIMAVCGATISTIPECSGSCTGVFSYTLDPSCASGPYDMSVTNSNSLTNCQNTSALLSATSIPVSNTFTGTCDCPASQYVISITDNSFFSIPVTINGAPTSNFNFNPPSFSLGGPPPKAATCNTSCDGTLTANPGGGVGPYTITVLPAVSGPIVTAAGFTLGGLCAGSYSFTIKDKNGCISNPFIKTVTAPTPVSTGSVATNIACNGSCTGSLVISPSGGNAGSYTVAFTPGGTFTVPPGGSASVQNLCVSAISATVTDVKGCKAVASTNITQPPALTVTPTQTNVSCFGTCDATASVSVSGGVSPYTYSWSPAVSNTNVATSLCAGTQTVTIKNNGGLCTNTVAFTITQPSSITITPTITNITCPGACTGSVIVGSSGGFGATTFTWIAPGNSTISTTSSITSQCAGSYTVVARDGNGCSTQSVVVLTAPPAFTLTSATQSITCFSTCTGGATVTVGGGTSPYTYTWSPAATTVAIGSGTTTGTNLCAGNYTVSIKDASLCLTNPVVLNISQSPSITPNITTTSLSCNNVCNGTINSAPSNGVGAYSFTLVTPAAASITTNPPYNGLCAGTYTLFIKDANCRQSFTVSLAQPNALVASVVSSSVSCFNACNGSLSGSVLGGTPGYTFVWATPTGTVAGGLVGSVCANQVYTFTATDANSCVITKTASVGQPTSAITATINQTAPTCNTSCNGSLNGVVAGGTPGYTLNWSNGFTGNPNTGLCAGNYTLTVTDANGCSSAFTKTLVAPPTITVSANTLSPTCAGACNGSATVTANGGTAPFIYQINTTPVVTNATGIFSGLCAGNYITNITDNNGCSQSANFSLNNPPALTPALTGLQSSCNNCGGAATVTPSGGVPGYTVTWTNSVSAVVGTGTAIAGLCVGNFTASVKDANGCIATVTTNVVQTVTVNVITGGTPIQCFGACTGSVVANPSGGALPYTYTWNPTGPPTQTTQTAVNLCAGNYTVTVKDNNGCANTGTVNLANPPAIVVNTTQTNATCFGMCDGVLSATATGGTGPLTYSWSPGGQTTSSINGLCAGPYTLTVKDGNNCPKVLTFNVTQTNSITATFTTTQPSGCGANNGSICVTPGGGNGGPYTFTWSPVAGNASCLAGLGAGVYSVVIGNAGCTTTLTGILTNPSGPTLNIATTSVNCFGGATGSATVTATGTAPFGFTWTPVGVGFVNFGNVSIGSSLNSGTYAISVSQSNSCITTQTINIATAPAFTVATAATNPKCVASCNGSITLVTSGGTPGYTFAWSSGTITGSGTQTVTNLCAGPYTVNITDANSCIKKQVFNLVDPPAIVLTNTATNVKCFGACNGTIGATSSGGTAPLSFNWVPVGAFSGSTTASVFNLCPAVYTVVVTDGNGCTKSNTINIIEPPVLTSTLTSQNATCSNSCNATATLVGSGGTPGYNFSWTGSASTTSLATGLCPGTYSGTITDANNCPVVKTFTVTAPAPFTATLASTSPLCNAACNGSIATSLSGAQGTVSFVWVPAGIGQNPTGLCANIYTLTATDNAGCQLSAVATLTNPPSVLANVTFTNPSCNASCNGIAVSSPANTTGAVSYSWSPGGAATQTVSALCAGNYTVQIQDQNGCQDVQTFTLTNPPLLNVTPSSAPATCSVSNGSITLLVSGGTPTYNFSWNPSVSTTSVASGLGAGIYTVVVTDVNNCTNTVSIPLSNSNGPSSAPVTSSSISCNAMCTGAASVNPATITGGTPGYTINWVSPASPNPLTGLCAGTYSAQITDAMSCILFTAVTISQPAPITINPNVGLPTCNGICNGSVTLTTSGGTPTYTYNWSPAAPNSSVITNVCAGTLTVQIIDSNLCPSTQTVDVPSVQNIAVTTATTNNLCFGTCAGSASVTTISNGIAPFTENWSNGQFGATASGLCNGTYTVMVTASNGCTNNFTTSITSPAQISATNAITSPSCNLCNGTSIATATGGVGPYTYSWTSGASTPTASNLCAGLYQVLVTDNLGCNQIINVPISNVPGITGENFTILNEQCAGACNGAATVQAVGGTAPITYTWMTNPAVTNSVAVSLCSGSYFVQMQDAQGCIRTSSTTIGSSPGLTLSPFISPPACTGPPNGTINIVPAGGTGPYTYTWIPAGNTSSLTNIGPGNYTVSVTDANGCSKTSAFTLSSFNNPSITYTQTNVNCNGACTGSIVALGTSTAGPVTYSWSAGGGSSSITNICPGIITLTVTSTTDNCMALQSFTVTDNPALQLSISNVQNVKCFGDCDGQVTLIPSGGILPYTFTWTPGSASNPQFSLCAGSYSGTVTDSKGCMITTTATISGPLQPLAITNTVVNSSCSTSADGSASVTLNGGTPTYTYNWTSAPSFTSNSQNLTNILAGTYILNAVDANSCTISTTVQIIPTVIVDAQAGRDSVFCSGGAILLNGSNSVGANGGFTWTNITPIPTVTVANTSTVNVMPAVGSNTYVLLVVSSVSTCVDRDTIVVNSLPVPVVDAGPSYTIPLFSNITIGGNPTAPTGITFTWSPALTLDNSTIPNPTASNTLNTTYTITVTDVNGCTASDTTQVLLYPEIKIPNGFSPNGDSRNDKWIIDNINQFTENVVEVYNRWGELLFRSEGYNVPFDGKYNGKDLPVGTYYYIINLNHPAYPKPYTGPLTIFR